MARVEAIKEYNKITCIINTTKKDKYKLLLACGFYTGFRISDLLTLRVKDIKGNYITVIEKKTKKKRTIPISKSLEPFIKNVIDKLNDNDYIFTSQKSKGLPMTRQHADRIIKKACLEVGIKQNIGCHTLRKSSAYMIFKKNNNDVMLAKEYLNHTNIRDTYIYLDLNQEYINEGIERAFGRK